MKRGCDVASHPRIDNTKAKTAERYGTQMSRSEDYLDQLLKGVAPGKETDAEPEQDTSEENLFSDILEEFADESTEEDDLEETFDDEDIFGDDFFDDDFLDADFLEEFERELAELEEDVTEETGSEEDALSLFDDLDSIISGAKEKMEVEPEPEAEPVVEAEPAVEVEPTYEVEAEPEVVLEPEMAFDEESETGAEPELVAEDDGDDALAALLGMSNDASAEEPVTEPAGGDFSFADLFADDDASGVEETPQEDPDVLKILEGLDGIDLELDEEDSAPTGGNQDFSALEGFLAASAADPLPESSNMDIESFAFEESAEPEEKPVEEKKAKKEKKAGEKTGFMNKLGVVLFGEDDEDDEEDDFVLFKKKGAAKTKAKPVPQAGPAEQENVTIGAASEDDLALFGDYSGASASAAPVEEEPKKGKKEKKKKEKKEKVKKEKKPRPKKEKKPKKPKEPDNTPPLPKKPVFLIFLMVASFVALVILGADLLGYSNQLNNAKNQYAKKNYSEAFAEVSGMEIKEEDMALYNKYHVMAMVSVELEAYESLMSQEFYDMALDCLVRTVGRAEKYRADAENYGCIQELNELELKAETILSETFGVSREEALEFYSYRNKKDYSTALAKVLKELGLEKVTE